MTIFLTSDLHLHHHNIIRYCNRAFPSIEAMDATLIQNWNETVAPDDTVYFLGDLTIKKRRYWDLLERLNGVKVLVHGNHDPDGAGTPYLMKTFENVPFLLIHNPANIISDTIWTIHGHWHNNTPYMDAENKRINISVENTEYRPIAINKILEDICQLQSPTS